MANLDFYDKHNMVAFLKKPQGSEDFHQILDFLKASHIRYALTENPTIHVSLINQFCRTASVRTLDNGEIELNATVDGHDKTITEASVKRHLKLADEMHDGLGRATTTVSSLEAEQGSGNISKTQTKAIPSWLSSLRTSSEGGLGCHFTMGDSPVQARPERLSNLPMNHHSEKNELTSTKAVYNKALITLTNRVKKLVKKLKHKRKRAIIDSSKKEEASLDHEDFPKQGRMIEEINKDENVNLVKSNKQGEAHETAEYRIDFSTSSPQTNDDETLAKTLLNIKKSGAEYKEKAIMQESESPKKIKKKEMIQIREGSSKASKSLKRSAEEELGHEQRVEEEIAQQEDVVAKQAKKKISKKDGGRLKRKTSKAREDKDKRQKKHDDPKKLPLIDDDEFKQVRVLIIRIMAEQTVTFEAMADASNFPIYNLSEPLPVVHRQ
nr:hypothetical protein [Tanacetum cinerariifolium]